MSQTSLARDAALLRERAIRFMTLFNQDDLDRILQTFAEDAAFTDAQGAVHSGRAAVTEALTPIVRGAYGQMRYVVDDVIAEEATGKALVTWTMTLTADGAAHKIRGLDILHFDGEQLKSKESFCKAAAILLE